MQKTTIQHKAPPRFPFFIAGLLTSLHAARHETTSNPIGGTILDRSTFADWVDGHEAAILRKLRAKKRSGLRSSGPQKSQPRFFAGVKIRPKAAPLVTRHLRIGFTEKPWRSAACSCGAVAH